MKPLTSLQEMDYENATKCHICEKELQELPLSTENKIKIFLSFLSQISDTEGTIKQK